MLVNGFQPVIGFPVHTLGLGGKRIIDSLKAAQSLPDLLGASDLALPRGFGLGLVAKPMAFAAEKRCAPIENAAAPVAPGAAKPLALAAEFKGRPVEKHGLRDGLPLRLASIPAAIIQLHVAGIGNVADVSRWLIATFPVQAVLPPRLKPALLAQEHEINALGGLACRPLRSPAVS